jgi:hypothetical protein
LITQVVLNNRCQYKSLLVTTKLFNGVSSGE